MLIRTYLYCHEFSVMANESEPSINSSFMARTKRKRRWMDDLRRGPPSWRGGADEDIIFLYFEVQVPLQAGRATVGGSGEWG